MSVREVVMFTALCDLCGHDNGEGNEIVAWESAESAVEVALEADWRRDDEGKLRCANCRSKPGGDWYDEDEEGAR